MAVQILRQTLVGLLMLTLVAPAWTAHVCACARRIELARKAAGEDSPAASAPMRACCAKKIAGKLAAKTPKPSQPGLKARCCCDEVRWNSSLAKVAPVRLHDPTSELASVVCDDVLVISANHVNSAGFDTASTVRAGPSAPVCILLCRSQI